MYPEEQPTEAAQEAPVVRRRRRPRWVPVAAAVAVVVVLLASITVLAWPIVFHPAAASTGGEVFLEPATAPGQDPFTDSVVFGNPPGTKSQTPIGAGDGIPTVRGDTPALYGGSTNEKVCDRAKLITFLQGHPDKAAAWAGVLGVPTQDIATYIGTLTPLQLRADTRVTNHGFKDGHATTLQSVLQAGTAVLVDDQGRPRVKCGCGNPLLDPVPTPVTPVYTGGRWDGFSERGVTAVSPSPVPVDQFVVYDFNTGQLFSRPRGTDGAADMPVVGPTPTPTPTSVVVPTPPVPLPAIRCVTGTHLRSGRCVSNESVVCPNGQTAISGRCVTVTVTCPAGTHPSDGGTSCDQNGISCDDGSHPSGDGTTCDPDTPTRCGDGQHRDDDGDCVPDCPTGTHESNDGSTCIPNTIPPCPAGQHHDSDGNCVPDVVVCGDGSQPVDNTCAPCPDGDRADAAGGCVPIVQPCPDGTAHDANGNCPVTANRRRRRTTPARRGADRADGRRRPTDPGSRGPGSATG